jgi:hypothetical protein
MIWHGGDGIANLGGRIIHAHVGTMVYYDRNGSEHAKLQEACERSMQNAELRQQVIAMGKSMADVLMERGRTEGWTEAEVKTGQRTLARLHGRRFGAQNPMQPWISVDQRRLAVQKQRRPSGTVRIGTANHTNHTNESTDH